MTTPELVTGRRSIQELSVDTQRLEQALLKVGIGETLEYDALSDEIKRDVQGAARGLLNSARRRLSRNSGIEFSCVRNIGLKRLGDAEIANTGQSVIRHINKSAAKGIRRLQSVKNFNALDNDSKIAHNFSRAALGLIHHQTTTVVTKKLSENASNQTEPVAMAVYLDRIKETL